MRDRLIALLVIVAAGAVCQTASSQPVAYVYGRLGEWCVGTRHLNPGDSLNQDELIKSCGRGSTDWIDIGYVNGEAKRVGCPTPSCETLKVKNLPTPSVLSRVTDVLSHFARSPRPSLAFALSRSLTGPQVQDAVLRTVDGAIELKPALASVPDGAYDALFRGEGVPRSVRIACEWKGGASRCRGTPAPGFYSLQLEQEGDAIGSPAAVLVTSSAEFDESTRTFQDALKLAGSWPPGIQPESRHFFLAIFLHQMSGDRQTGR